MKPHHRCSLIWPTPHESGTPGINKLVWCGSNARFPIIFQDYMWMMLFTAIIFHQFPWWWSSSCWILNPFTGSQTITSIAEVSFQAIPNPSKTDLCGNFRVVLSCDRGQCFWRRRHSQTPDCSSRWTTRRCWEKLPRNLSSERPSVLMSCLWILRLNDHARTC